MGFFKKLCKHVNNPYQKEQNSIILSGQVMDYWMDFNSVCQQIFIYQISIWGQVIQFETFHKMNWELGDRVFINISKN